MSMALKLPVVVVVAVALGAAVAVHAVSLVQQPPLSVNPHTLMISDHFGREVYIHGFNVVVKGYPWIPVTDHFDPLTSFSATDMAMMKQLGLNGIRLGTMWPGVEPQRGQYNQTYIDALAKLVVDASSYGIYSLLDMHQDVLSEKFCGEGVPGWAAQPAEDDFPYPLKPSYNVSPATGFPTRAECDELPWMAGYFTPSVGTAFEAIYTNRDQLRDAFGNFWRQVASTMKSLGAAVVGYELMNEPWAGDVWKNPGLLLPGIADKLYLQPTWDAVAQAIRTVDEEHIISFEGVTWDWFQVGFTAVPGGAKWINKSLLSYHFYIPPDFDLATQFAARKADMKRLGCGGILTEFALQDCPGCGNVMTTEVMDQCDAERQSWLIWEYKPFTGNKTGWSDSIWFPNGTLNAAVASKLSRTFAQYVAGRTKLMKFDDVSKYFILVYEVSTQVTSNETVVYMNRDLHYGNGSRIVVNSGAGGDAATATRDASDPNIVRVVHRQGLPPQTTISIEIFKK